METTCTGREIIEIEPRRVGRRLLICAASVRLYVDRLGSEAQNQQGACRDVREEKHMPYKRDDSPVWWVSFTKPSGKRIRRSTGTKDRKEAEALEAKWCAGGDSNPHGLPHWNLNPARLPNSATCAWEERFYTYLARDVNSRQRPAMAPFKSILPCLFLVLLAQGAPGASAFSIRHQGIGFDVYRLDKGEHRALDVFWKRAEGTPYSSIHALREALQGQGRELIFAVNGGIFSEQYTPLGLYIENGKRYYRLNRGDGGGNFFLLPNGVFYVSEEGPRVVQTKDYKPESRVISAIQSGPMLVIDGRLHPRFIKDYHR